MNKFISHITFNGVGVSIEMRGLYILNGDVHILMK